MRQEETPWYLYIYPEPAKRLLVVLCKVCKENVKISEAYPNLTSERMEVHVDVHVCKKEEDQP